MFAKRQTQSLPCTTAYSLDVVSPLSVNQTQRLNFEFCQIAETHEIGKRVVKIDTICSRVLVKKFGVLCFFKTSSVINLRAITQNSTSAPANSIITFLPM